jgi:hypothetical protein
VEKFRNQLSCHFNKTGFFERREAFYESLTWPNVPPEIKEAGVKLIERIAQAENKRHTIIHGMASEAEGPQPTEATRILIAREHSKYWFAEHFTVGQIEAIADEIADINGDLLRLLMYLYGAERHP